MSQYTDVRAEVYGATALALEDPEAAFDLMEGLDPESRAAFIAVLLGAFTSSLVTLTGSPEAAALYARTQAQQSR